MKRVVEYITGIRDGGAETLVKDYALLIDREEFDITIVTWTPLETYESANVRILKENHVKVVSLYKRWNLFTKLFHKFCKYWYLPLAFSLKMKQIKPDVIHMHLPLLRFVAPAGRYLRNIKLFYTCHNEPQVMFSKKNHPGEYRGAKKLVKTNHMRFIALHETMRRELNEMFGVTDTEVVWNGINFDRFKNVSASKTAIRQSLGIPENAFVVGNVGRMAQQKNQLFLIDIFKELHDIKPDAVLLLVGSGPLESDIKSRLSEYKLDQSAVLLSHRTDIPELMRAMDVFAFPSLFEGLPVTLVEAQVSGLWCVVSNRIDSDSFISPKVVEVDLSQSPKVWAETILNDKQERAQYGNMEQFDMKTAIKKLESLYL